MPKYTVCHHPELQAIDQTLLPGDLTLGDLPPRTEKLAKNYRKISEKSAKNTPELTKNIQQNHHHTLSGKKLPKNPVYGGKAQRLPPFPTPSLPGKS